MGRPVLPLLLALARAVSTMKKNVLALPVLLALAGAVSSTKRNVLVVISDDLRPELPCYGCDDVVAPHLSRLAGQSLRFTRAYVQEALCAPSRNSFLSGRRPDATRAWQFVDHFREAGPDWTTLPGAFKRAGFQAVGCGKVFHPHLPPNWDMPRSWDDRMNATWADWMYPSEPRCANRSTWCLGDDDGDYEDAKTTATALALLENVTAEDETPFFLAVGYRKPHLQWRVPKRVAALYPGGPGNVSLPAVDVAPEGAPGLAFHMPFAELSAFEDVAKCGGPGLMAPTAAYPESCQRSFRYGYRLAVSYVDEQLGVLLDWLDDHGLDEDTAVVFFGDHGWHLGDQGEWEKFTNYENAARTPLLIKAPWLPASFGRTIAAPVELVDVYPTLCGLLGVDVSYVAAESAPLAGRDLSGLLRGGAADDGHVALSTFPRCVGGENYNKDHARNATYADWFLNDCNDVPRDLFTHMGYSTRDERWRFTAWYAWDGAALRATGAPVALELYDHAGDDGACGGDRSAFDYETANLAGDPVFADEVAALLAVLVAKFDIPHG